MSEKDKIISEVRDALDTILKKPKLEGATTREWTAEVKAALCVWGLKSDFHVYAADVKGLLTQADKVHNERLYDVTCLKRDDDWYVTKIPLVAECEWGNEELIYYDFEKLLPGTFGCPGNGF